MSMSKKDYVAIARTLKARIPVMQQGYYGIWCADVETLTAVASDLAREFSLDNPRFDRAKFLAACGVQS